MKVDLSQFLLSTMDSVSTKDDEDQAQKQIELFQ